MYLKNIFLVLNVCLYTWVRHHNEDAVGAVSNNLWDDVFEDVDISLHKVESALAFLLPYARCHHHDT